MTPRRLAARSRLLIATTNAGKIAEFQALLIGYDIETVVGTTSDLGEPEENAADFAGNALIKAASAAGRTGLPALADDSGFAVASMNGAPGVMSARWATAAGGHQAAMRDIHDQAHRHDDRTACFICAIAIAWPDGAHATFQGRIDGVWTWPPRGAFGFGYDAMFVPDGQQQTFAEMSRPEKSAIGHRGRAFAAFAETCLP